MKLHSSTTPITILCLVFTFAATLGGRTAEPEKRTDLEFLELLRKLELDHLLELHCRDMIARETGDLLLRSRLTVELTELLSQRAQTTVDASERAGLWQRVDNLIVRFVDDNSEFGQNPLVLYRYAGQLNQRAKLLAELAIVHPDDTSYRDRSLTVARKATTILARVAELANREIERVDGGGKLSEGGLSIDQVSSLITASDFRLGTSWLAVARVETDATKRAEAIRNAEQRLLVYGRDYSALPIAFESHLALGELYHLAGNVTDATTTLRRLENPLTPKAFLKRCHLLLSQVLLDAGNVTQALELLDVPNEDQLPGAEWNLLLFEGLLRRGAEIRAADPSRANSTQARALTILDSLEEQYGRYWGRRGEQALTKYGQLDQVGKSLAVVRRLANVLRNDKKYEQAIENYDLAVRLANEEDDSQLAGELAFEAGVAAFESNDYSQAARRLSKLAGDMPGHALAARALLTAAFAWARLFAKTSDARALENYRNTLLRHNRQFSRDPETGPEVQWYLAELAERDRNWPEAIRRYQAVPPTHRRFASSLNSLAGIIHDQVLMKRDREGQAQAVKSLEVSLAQAPATLVDTAAGATAVATARYVLAKLLAMDGGERKKEAIAMLRDQVVREPALAQSAQARALRSRAWEALLDLCIDQSMPADAADAVTNGFPDGPPALIRSLSRLDPQDELLTPERRACEIAVVETAARRLLDGSESISSRDRFNLQLMRAQAAAAKGDHRAAQEMLERLAADAPRDPRILVSSARSDFAQGHYRSSLDAWNRLLKGFPRGSARWLFAMSNAIACHQQLGRRDEARRLLEVTLNLYSDLGTGDNRIRFERLRQSILNND